MTGPSGRVGPHPLAFAGALAVVYVVWGSTYLAMRFLVEDVPPFLGSAVRFLVAGVLLYGWMRLRGAARPTGAQWKGATAVAAFLLLGANGGVMFAEQWVASGLAALIIGMVPLHMAWLEPVVFGGRRVGPRTLMALVIGFAGVVYLVWSPDLWRGSNGIGVAVLLAAAFLWAYGSLGSRHVDSPSSSLLGASMQMIGGGLLMLFYGTAAGEWSRVDVGAIGARSWWALGYLIAFGSLAAYTSYIWLLRVGSPSVVGTYAYVNPLVAVLLGWALASEPLTPRVVLGGLLIVGSVAFVTQRRAKRTVEAVGPFPDAAGSADAAAADVAAPAFDKDKA